MKGKTACTSGRTPCIWMNADHIHESQTHQVSVPTFSTDYMLADALMSCIFITVCIVPHLCNVQAKGQGQRAGHRLRKESVHLEKRTSASCFVCSIPGSKLPGNRSEPCSLGEKEDAYRLFSRRRWGLSGESANLALAGDLLSLAVGHSRVRLTSLWMRSIRVLSNASSSSGHSTCIVSQAELTVLKMSWFL